MQKKALLDIGWIQTNWINLGNTMRHDHLHICLFQPEIPQNTGNIGRLAAGAGCRLHLIKPFGFDPNSKNLRRPGLDYWPYLDLEVHDSFDDLLLTFKDPPQMAFFSKFGQKSYTQMPRETNLLIFGRETSGLPKEFFEKYSEHYYSIPMFHEKVRSLNLANSVSIGLYHLLSIKEL